MRQHLANLGLVFLVGGCSLIYNPNNIDSSKHDAAIDAPPDAAIDANAADLTLLDAAPALIDEGQGDGGSRPEILVVHGTNFVAGATVSITGSQAVKIDVDNAHAVIAGTSDYLAVPVTAHVDPNLAESTRVDLTITVTQPAPGGGMVTQALAAGAVKLVGHDELTAPPTGTPNALYSQISVTSNITIAAANQSAPFALRAVSSISVANITAKGGDASGSSGGAAGPNGCAGAAAQADAGCTGGGKKGNTPGILGGTGGDGGGAGFAVNGLPGTNGSGPGAGGNTCGDDMIASYAANRAAGGGGGGGNGLSGSGGSGGGGGGGAVELTAGGTVMAGTIDVGGGVGGSASGGGGGGGGAGGVIMVRSGATISATMLSALGGGGSGGSMTDGRGSDGRIRWDAPTGTPPAAAPAAVRGPAFDGGTPLVLKTRSLQLVGTANHKFDVYWTDAMGQHNDAGDAGTAFDGTGSATITPMLARGFNHVCITIMGGQQGAPEADKCIDVAYLP